MPRYAYIRKFRKTKQKIKKIDFYSFDIETYGDDNKFYFATIYNGQEYLEFTKPEYFMKELMKKRYKGAHFVATNLQFDFFGIFEDTKGFKCIWRGSHLISVKTWVYQGKFYNYNVSKSAYPITFIDTLNYASMSLARLGKIIGCEKMKKPAYLGDRMPQTPDEWDYLIEYNKQDSYVTYEFIRLFYDTIIKLGGDFKLTIASTSMRLFTNKYLKEFVHIQKPKTILMEQFKAYYGGRTEVFKRGEFKNLKYYDVNSLYPAMMEKNEFPDPNTLRVVKTGRISTLYKYQGISEVTVSISKDCNIPLLPFRDGKGKLLFPTGRFRGWYTHAELTKAIDVGYKIHCIHKTHLYVKSMRPFKGFVNDLYNMRLEYKKIKSPMELICKLILNSHYGKYAQRFDDYMEWEHIDNIKADELPTDEVPEFSHDMKYVRIKRKQEPPSFSIPIWSIYVTAFARLHLFEYLQEHDPVYCDTDSIITRSEIPTSKALGDLKLECNIKKAIFIKPKMYMITTEHTEYSRIKGVSKAFDFQGFKNSMQGGTFNAEYTQFIKFRSAIRRKLKVNSKIKISKILDLNDSKRRWDNPFSLEISNSKPIYITT